MKIAITGAAGQLGRELCRRVGGDAQPLERAAMDIADHQKVRRVLAETRPDAVINCAAYTQVDLAEQEAELRRTVNAHAVANRARECQQVGAA